MTTPEHQRPRRFIQGPVTTTMARPALREEVMRALHHRPDADKRVFIEVSDVERIMEPRDWGVWSTLQALAEYDMVELFPAARGRRSRVLLTQIGRKWKPAPQGEAELWDAEPMLYVMRHEHLGVATLAQWAKAWEAAHYAGGSGPETTLLTWLNRDPGYPVVVDRMPSLPEDEWIQYRVWAAGEMVSVCIDGRA